MMMMMMMMEMKLPCAFFAQDPKTHVYMCGLKGMESGFAECFQDGMASLETSFGSYAFTCIYIRINTDFTFVQCQYYIVILIYRGSKRS